MTLHAAQTNSDNIHEIGRLNTISRQIGIAAAARLKNTNYVRKEITEKDTRNLVYDVARAVLQNYDIKPEPPRKWWQIWPK